MHLMPGSEEIQNLLFPEGKDITCFIIQQQTLKKREKKDFIQTSMVSPGFSRGILLKPPNKILYVSEQHFQ